MRILTCFSRNDGHNATRACIPKRTTARATALARCLLAAHVEPNNTLSRVRTTHNTAASNHTTHSCDNASEQRKRAAATSTRAHHGRL